MVDDLRAMVAEQEHARAELEQGRQQLEVTLQEMRTVQQRYLRERWEQYPEIDSASSGYYRLDEEEGPTEDAWLPAMASAMQQTEVVSQTEPEATLAIPLQLHGEVVGVLGFSREGTELWTEEELAAAMAIAGEVAYALDRQRLFDETQQALIETERLYEASAELAESQSYDEVLNVLRTRTLLGRADHSTHLYLFDRAPGGDEVPDWSVPVARWSSGASAEAPHSGLQDLPSASELVQPDTPTIVTNVEMDPRVEDQARSLYLERLGVHSAVSVPLNVRGQWIGYVDALFTEHTEFSDAEIRRLMVLAGQAAIVIQNLRQLEEARARAQRERILREVTTRMRTSADPDSVARTAVRELGTALGRRVFLRLGSAEQLSSPAGAGGEGHGDGSAARDGGEPSKRPDPAEKPPDEGGE
jgi:GAF domain-containing protein